MKRDSALLAAAFIGACVVSGCSSVRFTEAGARPATATPAIAAGTGSVLLAASERTMFEEMDTEVEGYAPPKPKSPSFAVRAGLFAPGATEDVEYDSSVTMGLALDIIKGKAMKLEISADHSSVTDTTGERTSTLILLGAAARFAPGGGAFYLVGSATLVMEEYSDSLTGDAASTTVPLFGVGLGLRPGALDLRVGYAMPLAGGGPAALTASGGYAF